MPSRAESKKSRLLAWLAEHRPGAVDERAWNEIRERLAPVSDSYLRELLKGSGVALDPVVEGVNSHTFGDLERTLRGLEERYSASDNEGRRRIRALVIEAKNRLRWAARRSEDSDGERTEKLLWVMTWLENPEVFRLWIRLRRERLAPRVEGGGASG